MTSKQLSPLETMSWIQQTQKQRLRVVQCHGVFDLLHIGHIRYLQQARRLGDRLLVTITPDRFVNKGPHRPAFQEELRAAAVAALDCVDAVMVTSTSTAVESLQELKPDCYVKGSEFKDHQTPALKQELAVCKKLGIAVHYIDEVTSSSSFLLNQFMSSFAEETTHFLEQFKTQYSLSQIEDVLNQFADLNVLVVGDASIEEIYECEAITQSARAPIVATKYQSHRSYPAGAAAVAGHVSRFAKTTELICLGQQQLENLRYHDVYKGENSRCRLFDPTPNSAKIAVKRRYRESYFSVPMFEINFPETPAISSTQQEKLELHLKKAAAEADLILIWDQGRATFGSSLNMLLQNKNMAEKTAVCFSWDTAEEAARQYGLYHHAQLIQLGEQELRQFQPIQNEELEPKLQSWAELQKCERVLLTRGQHGCWAWTSVGNQQLPALANRVVDRTGAQEAFFALAALTSGAKGSLELAAFLGNIAGAQSVAQVSTEAFLDRQKIDRHLLSLWK